jgi:hypothetical protein
MPRRPRAHIVGDRALAAVARVLSDAGFTAETLAKDYGEDLFVQTSHAGEIDASRLWFQVKGTENITRYRKQTQNFALSVPYDHAIKWIRSADPVVVVLWDVASDSGYWCWPLAQVDEWSYSRSGNGSTTLRFAAEDIFTTDAAMTLAWASRIHHYRRLLLNAHDLDNELNDSSEALPNDPGFHPLTSLVLFDFFALLKLIEIRRGPPEASASVLPGVRDRYVALRDDALRDNPDKDRAAVIAGHAFMEEHVEHMTGTPGLPKQLFVESLTLLLWLLNEMPQAA